MSFLTETLTRYFDWIRNPIAPRSMGVFRIWFGLLCLMNIILVWPDLSMWLGSHGVLPDSIHQNRAGMARISLYWFLGRSDDVIGVINVLGVVASFGLILGIWARASAAILWLIMATLSWRNPMILHSGDTLMRIGLFFMIFAKSDAAFSLARWLRVRRGQLESGVYELIPAWPVRILQIQLCIVYLATAFWKAKGVMWLDGSAVGTVLQLGELQRFPLPDFIMTATASKILSWSTLAVEFGFPFLIWIPRLRIPVLLAGLALHLGLEWSLNIPLFQWTMTSFYILFLDPALKSFGISSRDAQLERTHPISASTSGRPALAGVDFGKAFKVLIGFATILPFLYMLRLSLDIDGERYFVLSDDAMVSMRYARNLADGFGLVWNPGGDRVEGFSNLLWTVYMSLVHFLPIPSSKMSLVVSLSNIAIGVGLLFGIKKISGELAKGRSLEIILSCALLVFYWPLMFWMGMGFEVGLNALFLVLLWVIFLSTRAENDKLILTSVILSLALMTRYDAASPLAAFALIAYSRRGTPAVVLKILALPMVTLALLTAWRLYYYGDPLPNTYYLKLTGVPLLQRLELGLLYFGKSFWGHLWLLFALALLGARDIQERERRMILTPIIVAVIYTIWIGGDTWEQETLANRMISSVMPPIFILVAFGATKLMAALWRSDSKPALAFYIWLLLWSFWPRFSDWVVLDYQNYELHRKVRTGVALKSLANPGDKIAVSWAGAIPYFSNLESIDLLGKNDRYIARLMPKRIHPPGHTKYDLDYSIGEKKPRFIDEIYMPTASDLENIQQWGYKVKKSGLYELESSRMNQ